MEEHHDLYSTPNIIRVIKSRRMRWAGHAARMGDRRGACRVLVGIHKEGDHLEYLVVDGRVILKSISMKCDGGTRDAFIWLRIGEVAGSFDAVRNFRFS
jgi:hypothetical protein